MNTRYYRFASPLDALRELRAARLAWLDEDNNPVTAANVDVVGRIPKVWPPVAPQDPENPPPVEYRAGWFVMVIDPTPAQRAALASAEIDPGPNPYRAPCGPGDGAPGDRGNDLPRDPKRGRTQSQLITFVERRVGPVIDEEGVVDEAATAARRQAALQRLLAKYDAIEDQQDRDVVKQLLREKSAAEIRDLLRP